MKRVLVTGGAGFIGSAVCRYLVKEKGCEVLNLDKLTYAGVPESLREIEESPLYRFVKADVCDKEAVSALFSEFKPDAVMHLAAESHVDRSIDGPSAFIETNIVGTYNMLDCALAYWRGLQKSEVRGKVSEGQQPGTGSLEPGAGTESQLPKATDFRFHHISTDEVYGSLGEEGLFEETTPYDPRSPYSASKASSDHLVKAWFHTYGLPVVVTNCSNNYGPYHFPEKLIPLVILNALDEKPLPIYGKGDQIRDWLYVEDHARALVRVLENGEVGETYNIGGCNEQKNIDVVKKICALLEEMAPDKPAGIRHYKDLITYVKDRPGHDRRYAIDAGKIDRELGWSPSEDFDSGLRKTVIWYLDNKDWWQRVLDGSYRLERIGTGS